MVDFTYKNPTTLYFGENKIEDVIKSIKEHGNKVLLVTGGKSFKANGFYDQLVNTFHKNGLKLFECSKNIYASLKTTRSAIKFCKEKQIDFVLGIGGGVCMDLAKAIAYGAVHNEDIWLYLTKQLETDDKWLPIGTIVTFPSSGSEMDGACQITNDETKQQTGLWGVYPKFSWLNPTYVMPLPNKQLAYGQITAFIQASVEFLSLNRSEVTEAINLAIIKQTLLNLDLAYNNPTDKEARSNLMLTSALITSGLLWMGKDGDYAIYDLEGIMETYYEVNYTTSITTLFPYWLIFNYDSSPIFKKYFNLVLDVDLNNLSDQEILNLGINNLFKIYDKYNVKKSFKELKDEPKSRSELAKIINENLPIESQYKELNLDNLTKLFINAIEGNTNKD